MYFYNLIESIPTFEWTILDSIEEKSTNEMGPPKHCKGKTFVQPWNIFVFVQPSQNFFSQLKDLSKMPKAKYVDDEASSDESDAGNETYESDAKSEISEEECDKPIKRRKQDKDDSEKPNKKGVVVSNKKIDPSTMPKKPVATEMIPTMGNSKKSF